MPAKSRHTSDRTVGASLGGTWRHTTSGTPQSSGARGCADPGLSNHPNRGLNPFRYTLRDDSPLKKKKSPKNTEGCTRDRLCTYMAHEQQALGPRKAPKLRMFAVRRTRIHLAAGAGFLKVNPVKSMSTHEMPSGCKQKQTLHPRFTYDQPRRSLQWTQ